ELNWPSKSLEAARATLEAHGDQVNAAHARYLELRRLLLIGRLDEAERLLAGLDPARLPMAFKATHELALAGIAMRRLRARSARQALARAARVAGQAGIPALAAEVDGMARLLDAPAARRVGPHGEQLLSLDQLEALLGSPALVV